MRRSRPGICPACFSLRASLLTGCGVSADLEGRGEARCVVNDGAARTGRGLKLQASRENVPEVLARPSHNANRGTVSERPSGVSEYSMRTGFSA